jgi:hypothetical protein
MFQGLFGFQFDLPEFLLGLFGGFLLLLAFNRGLPMARDMLKWGSGQASAAAVVRTSAARDRYRREIETRAQGTHLARALFLLEDIVVPPRLLAPPFPADPSHTEQRPEDTLGALPNLPDWVTMAGIYQTASLSLPTALRYTPRLLITGEPGSGKTTALAYLTIVTAKHAPQAGDLANAVPFFFHAADLRLGRWDGKDPLEPLIAAAQPTVSGGMAGRLPSYVRQAFRQQTPLVLVDGLDELNLDEVSKVSAWLQVLEDDHPEARIVAAGPPRGYDGLVGQARLAPAPLAPWSEHDQRTFMAKFGAAGSAT